MDYNNLGDYNSFNIHQDYEEVHKYQTNYNEENFFKKIIEFGRKAGESVVYAGLLLFAVLKSSEAKATDRAIIIGALGYFILPIDIIPDILPGGYLDDFGILMKALTMVKELVTEDMKDNARKKIKKIFKSYKVNDLEKVEELLKSKNIEIEPEIKTEI